MTNQEMYEKSEELMPKLVELLRQLPGIASVTVYPEGHVSITSNVRGEGCRSFWHDGEMKFPDRVDFLSEKQMADIGTHDEKEEQTT